MRNRTSSLVISSLLLLPLGVACGTSDIKRTNAVPTVQNLSKGLCDFAYRCCVQGEIGFYYGPFLTKDTCAERLLEATEVSSGLVLQIPAFPWLQALLPNVGALDRALQEGRTAVDAGALNACLDDLKKEACNTPPKKDPSKACKPLQPPPEKTVCDPRKIFVGTLGEGSTCTSGAASLECAPGLLCARTSGLGQEGECVRAGKDGDYCAPTSGGVSSSVTDGGCDMGLYCSLLDGKCRKPGREGEPCAYADHLDPSPDPATLLAGCRSDLSCDPITDTCVARCAAGAACASDKDCDETQKKDPNDPNDPGLRCIVGHCGSARAEGLPCAVEKDCDQGLYCVRDLADPTHSRCRPKKPNGQPCATGVGSTGSPHAECESGFCDPTVLQCAPQVPPGQACPSRTNEQCQDGSCKTTFTSCTSDADCSGGTCNLSFGQCSPFCVALKEDGAICTLGTDCVSHTCVVGFCRTPPLVDGADCSADSQCKSEFCGLEKKRVCTRLPLAIGDACGASGQCESFVCYGGGSISIPGTGGFGTGGIFGTGGFGTGGFGTGGFGTGGFGTGGFGTGGFGTGGFGGTGGVSGFGNSPTCTAGLGEGERCGTVDKPPCDPNGFFCDSEQDPPKCAPFHETGETCKRDDECRGACAIKAGRKMCDDTPRPDGAVCDGKP